MVNLKEDENRCKTGGEVKTLLLGGQGFIGKSLLKKLKQESWGPVLHPHRSELDLNHHSSVIDYLSTHQPVCVIMAAAKVGGIGANRERPVDFLMENLTLQNNIFTACLKARVERLIFFGSSCLYPMNITRPIQEEDLLTGPFEPTNEPYAVAKLAGVKAVESIRRQFGLDYFTIIPSNVYGPGDHFFSERAHVIPSIIYKLHEAQRTGQTLQVWGSGRPVRDFIFVEDVADAILFLLKRAQLPSLLNIGTEYPISIKELVQILARLMNYDGAIHFDETYPDGMPHKVLDSSKIKELGWRSQVSLEEGLVQTIQDFRQRLKDGQ